MTTLTAILDNPAFAIIMAGVFGAIGYFIKGMPDRLAARTAAKVSENNTDAGLREELHRLSARQHLMGNEVMMVKAQLMLAENDSRNLIFVVELVMDELAQVNPENSILGKARVLLAQISTADLKARAVKINEIVSAERESRHRDDEAAQSETMNAAQRTERAAHDTVNQVRENERGL